INPMDLVYSLLVMIRAHEESDTKAKRVRSAIRRQCEGWLAGTYRGIIQNGKDPLWVRRAEAGGFELIPELVAVVRAALDLFRKGCGGVRLVDELKRRSLALSERGAPAVQIYRLVRQRALIGDKELEVDGQTFELPGYYPAVLSAAEWGDLQALVDDRH